MEIQKIQMVVHIFSGFAGLIYGTSSKSIAESNPSAGWPRIRCFDVQVEILFLLKLISFESLAGNDFFERGTQAAKETIIASVEVLEWCNTSLFTEFL